MRILVVLFICICLKSVGQNPSIKWHYDVNDMSFGQSAAEDVDGDGKLEIAFSTYRNDSSLYVLNAEDGSILWKYNTGGCNDVAPLIYDVDQDGDFEIVLPGSCNPVTFCFDADSGYVEWQTPTRGSDSPPTIGDIDNDDKLEILHGQFGGYVLSLNGEDGSVNWDLEVDANSWIQTAPAILDVDQNGQLDFVVANWNFGDDHRIFCYKGDDQTLMWSDTLPADYMYHGVAYCDLDDDGKDELTIGDYEGNLFCYNAEDGSLSWQYSLPYSIYIGAPTSIGDLDNDGDPEVVFIDYNKVAAVSKDGILKWSFTIPNGGQSFRGVAIADVNNDNFLDVTFGTSTGLVISLDGKTGILINSIDLATHYGDTFEIDHAPIIADFDNDDTLDVFIVGGHAEYPDIQNNYGRAYAISWGKGNGPDWKMFRRDYRRSGSLCNDTLLNSIIKPAEEFLISDELYPNPTSKTINLRVYLDEPADLEIKLYDLSGRLMYDVGSRTFSKGINNFQIDMEDMNVTPGIYFITLKGTGTLRTYKCVLIE